MWQGQQYEAKYRWKFQQYTQWRSATGDRCADGKVRSRCAGGEVRGRCADREVRGRCADGEVRGRCGDQAEEKCGDWAGAMSGDLLKKGVVIWLDR